MPLKCISCFLALLVCSSPVNAIESFQRFQYQGDGQLTLQARGSGKKITINYIKEGTAAHQQINSLFGMPAAQLGEGISLRLIAMIDYLEDEYSPGQTINLTSGYRSPQYNESLRQKGQLAGKTSYHMEGMAADLIFPGADHRAIWEGVRLLNCCGVGHYGAASLHLDSGKPRFWEAATALPPENENPLNRNIHLDMDYDYYAPGETMRLFFSAISHYPFGLKNWFEVLNDQGKVLLGFAPQNALPNACLPLKTRKEVRFLAWKIPEQSKRLKGSLTIRAQFCDPLYEKMPLAVSSRVFWIKTRTIPRPHPPV